MPLDPAWEKAIEELVRCSPYVVDAKSGASFDKDKFTLHFFNRTIFVYHPRVRIEELGEPNPPSKWVQLILLHYLLTADGTPVADYWITYRYLPGAYFFESRFHSLAINSLLQTFGKDAEGFRRAALSLGGMPMTRSGDVAFRFLAMPQLPLACVLYLGDEEIAPSVNILFDASAPHYLPTEDLSYLGTYLSQELQRLRNP